MDDIDLSLEDDMDDTEIRVETDQDEENCSQNKDCSNSGLRRFNSNCNKNNKKREQEKQSEIVQ